MRRRVPFHPPKALAAALASLTRGGGRQVALGLLAVGVVLGVTGWIALDVAVRAPFEASERREALERTSEVARGTDVMADEFLLSS